MCSEAGARSCREWSGNTSPNLLSLGEGSAPSSRRRRCVRCVVKVGEMTVGATAFFQPLLRIRGAGSWHFQCIFHSTLTFHSFQVLSLLTVPFLKGRHWDTLFLSRLLQYREGFTVSNPCQRGTIVKTQTLSVLHTQRSLWVASDPAADERVPKSYRGLTSTGWGLPAAALGQCCWNGPTPIATLPWRKGPVRLTFHQLTVSCAFRSQQASWVKTCNCTRCYEAGT